jgi:uncharacterized protein YegJ (DUF2314 family)
MSDAKAKCSNCGAELSNLTFSWGKRQWLWSLLGFLPLVTMLVWMDVWMFRGNRKNQKGRAMNVQRALGFATMAAFILAIIGCKSDKRNVGDTVEREGQPPISYVADDDPKMTAAMAEARRTVDRFILSLNNPKPSQSSFSVKLLIEDGDHGEHMWILPVRYEGGKFYGTINNEPDKVTTVKIGDEVSVAKDQVSDWMYIENRKLVGGYTLRVLRNSMPEKEREEFDRGIPFTID